MHVRDEDDRLIAEVCTYVLTTDGPIPDPDGMDNAQLIVAAPTMYKALAEIASGECGTSEAAELARRSISPIHL